MKTPSSAASSGKNRLSTIRNNRGVELTNSSPRPPSFYTTDRIAVSTGLTAQAVIEVAARFGVRADLAVDGMPAFGEAKTGAILYAIRAGADF